MIEYLMMKKILCPIAVRNTNLEYSAQGIQSLRLAVAMSSLDKASHKQKYNTTIMITYSNLNDRQHRNIMIEIIPVKEV